MAFHALETTACRWPNGSAGVDLFFVISGFVMAISSRRLATRLQGWRDFLRHRLVRIVPLYWLLTLAKTVLTLAAPALAPSTRITAWNLAASLLFIPARDAAGIVRPVLPVGWTLNYEMAFYLVFAVSLAWRRPPLAVLLPVLLPLGVAGFWRANDWPAVLSLANGLVLELCAGVALAAILPRLRLTPRAAAALLAAGLALLLLVPPAGPWRCLAWGAPAVLVVAGTVALERYLARLLPDLLVALGEASYAIYLSHVFLIPALSRALATIRLAPVPHAAALLLASLLVCPAVGLALHIWVDAPMQARLRRGSNAGPALAST